MPSSSRTVPAVIWSVFEFRGIVRFEPMSSAGSSTREGEGRQPPESTICRAADSMTFCGCSASRIPDPARGHVPLS
jgi:hypothetical protein